MMMVTVTVLFGARKDGIGTDVDPCILLRFSVSEALRRQLALMMMTEILPRPGEWVADVS